MAEMIELKEQEERVILVAVSTGEDDDTAASVDELEELASTAGAVTVGKVIQNRENVHPGTYLGKGTIEVVKTPQALSVTTSFPRPSLKTWRTPWIRRSWTAPW